MQVPLQAFSQQTPSTQKPLWQAPAPPQAAPFASCGTQLPLWQKLPAVQSAVVVQVLRQLPVPQTYAPHDPVTPGAQVPAPSQVGAAVSVVPVQVSEPQTVVAA